MNDKFDFKYVFFDFDGTLFDTEADIAHSVNAVRKHHGFEPIPQKLISSFVGNGVEILMRKSFEGITSDSTLLKKYQNDFFETYSANPVIETTFYPGVEEILNKIDRKVIVSNKDEKLIRKILENFGILQDFLFVVGGDTFEVKKPHPDLMNEMKKLSGFNDLEKSIMVGDGQPDHDFAKISGIPFICCDYGFSNVVDDYSDMVRISHFKEIEQYL